MSVSMVKGQKVSLAKRGGGTLTGSAWAWAGTR